MLLDGTTLQVPFLADLVTLADPTNRELPRVPARARAAVPVLLFERFDLPRREYDHYCRWVASALPSCRFGARVQGSTGRLGPIR